eukprot:c1799_g1_i2.p1 GENE.c1799_g1_i2~~c1799_g1_i2.p1  ORF type:complete len:545 (+),score=124.62 c1799_g1_i2:3-1637(+)
MGANHFPVGMSKRLACIHDPFVNKGSAFTPKERIGLKIRGLIPTRVETMEMQLVRVRAQFDSEPTPLSKYSFLAMLQDTNQSLFYKFLLDHLVDCLPIVYTPTVGLACQEYSHIFRRPQGMYLSVEERGHVRKLLDNWPEKPEIIVVTDGGRILGLGDQGLNGMGIPIGKLSLYVAGAGFNPAKTLPITLDVGTNNQKYLDDPMYLGLKHNRVPEEEYYTFLDEFCMAVKHKWPKCLVQFEDFATPHAIKLLEDYRTKMLCFNDDIQGTGSVILAGFLNALKIQGTNPTEVRCVFFGAGSAAIGVAQTIAALLETLGLSNEEARRRFWLIDSQGLLVDSRQDAIAAHKLPFVRPGKEMKDLREVIEEVKPHILMGLAGHGRSFFEEHVAEMYKHCKQPIIFPLSNPTSKAEITAEDAYTWTNGDCIFAAGSPFDPVELNGKTYYPAQGNNLFIFPGVGLGAVLCESKQVTDLMFINAAKALAEMVSEEDLKSGKIYPSLKDLRDVSVQVAIATINTAYEQKLTTKKRSGNLGAFVRSKMWVPDY